MLAKILVSGLYSIQLLSVLRKHLVIGQFSLFSFFSAFHWLLFYVRYVRQLPQPHFSSAGLDLLSG